MKVLAPQGFGILTEIDVDAAFDKLPASSASSCWGITTPGLPIGPWRWNLRGRVALALESSRKAVDLAYSMASSTSTSTTRALRKPGLIASEGPWRRPDVGRRVSVMPT